MTLRDWSVGEALGTDHRRAHNMLETVLVNVKDAAYGATGDGVTNDYAAILAAYNDVPSSGGILYFPPGTYISNTALTVTKPITILGAGANTSKLKRTANVHGIVTSNVTGVTIRDMGFVSTQSTGHRNNSIYLSTSTVDAKIDSCLFETQSATCVAIESTGMRDIRVTNCRANEVWEQFVDVTSTDLDGLYVAGNIMRTTDANNDIAPAITPWFSVLEPTGTTATINHVRYVGNSADFTGLATADVTNSGGFAISKVATNGVFRNISITGNTLRRVGTFVKVDSLRWGTPTEAGDIVITGNNFEDAAVHGLNLKPGFADATYKDAIIVVGNNIHGASEVQTNTYDGIILDGYAAGGIIISGNVIKRRQGALGANLKYGIEIGGNIQSAVVQGNYVDGTGTAPYIDGGSNNVLLNNYADGVDYVFDSTRTRVIATGSLPAAAAAQNGRMVIEDNGAGDRNLIIYAGGQRFRIDGGAAI